MSVRESSPDLRIGSSCRANPDQHKTGVRHDDHAELRTSGIDRAMLREQERGVTTLRSDGDRGDDSGLAPWQVIFIDQRGALPQCRAVRRYSIPDLDVERTDVNVGHVVMPTVPLASGIEMGSRVDLIRCRETAGFRAASFCSPWPR